MTRVSFVDRDNGEILDEVDFNGRLWAAAFVYGMESLWYAIAEEHIRPCRVGGSKRLLFWGFGI
jgi:hypothetical protein